MRDVGDISSHKLAKTPIAKSVVDAGWGLLKTQLSYKGHASGRSVIIVSENTTRACSNCGALTGPKGLDMLDVRAWVCGGCGVIHPRQGCQCSEEHHARGEVLAVHVLEQKTSPSAAPPSQAPRVRKAGNSAVKAAA